MAKRQNSLRKSANDMLIKENNNNPFQSMYAQSFVDPTKRQQSKFNTKNQITTPRRGTVAQKYNEFTPEAKKSMSSSRLGGNQPQNTYELRRFGQYQGPQFGSVYEQSQLNQSQDFGGGNPALRTFASGFSGTYSQGAQSVGRRTRCSDRFVKYPYPKTMITNYQKEYHQKNNQTSIIPQKEAFNPEKEHKVINPHRMEQATTNKISYKPFQVMPQKKEMRRVEKNDAPAQQSSSYQSGFPNWNNGHQDVYHEKHPQYPYYSLPFKGQSSYANNFTEEQMRALRKHQEMVAELGKQSSNLKQAIPFFRQHYMIRVNHYQPQQFDFETTNQKVYQAFKLTNRPTTSKPVVEAVRTKAFPQHFDTQNKKEFVQHQIRVPEIDLIPYP